MKHLTLLISLVLITGLAAGLPVEDPDTGVSGNSHVTGKAAADVSDEIVTTDPTDDEINDDEVEIEIISENVNSSGKPNVTSKLATNTSSNHSSRLLPNTSHSNSRNNSSTGNRSNRSNQNNKSDDEKVTGLERARMNAKAELEIRIEKAKVNYLEAKAKFRSYSEDNETSDEKERKARENLRESRRNYEEAEKDQERLQNASSEREIQSIMADASADLNESFSNSQNVQKTLESEPVQNYRAKFYRNLGIITTLFMAITGGGFLYYKIPRKSRSEEQESSGETGE